MDRYIDEYLLSWKTDKRRKPLIVRGARQVGKTYSINEFAKKHFSNVIKIDFEKEPSIKNIFDENLDPVRICREIELIKNTKITPGKSILFFDEVQECGNAIMSLRYFFEEIPDLHVIASGSLLEFALSDLSFPVGRIQFYEMYPMTFPEFLLACDKNNLHEVVTEGVKRLSDSVHDILLNELKYFFFIGGMPESVRTYIETGSIKKCQDVHTEIIDSLKLDFAKYSPKVDKYCLNSALTEISSNVGKQTKYSTLANGYSNPTLKKAYQVLQMAKLIQSVTAINPIGLPVKVTSSKIFKTVLLDIGLMNNLCGLDSGEEFLKTDLLSIYRGAMAEQYVAQEFSVGQKGNVYYWDRQARSSIAEVDFVIQKQNKLIPVEVKSGKGGTLRSLHLYMNEYPKTEYGIVLSTQHYSLLKDQKLKFIPLYFAHTIGQME